MKINVVALFILMSYSIRAQDRSLVSPFWLENFWTARWILHPSHGKKEYGVFHFRKKLELPSKPSRYVVHVTADNRYELFVNGRMVAMGPARGNGQSWYFETIDLSPYLSAGINSIAAKVWNMGEGTPAAQVSYQTGLLLQGDTDAEKGINTDDSWKVYLNSAYSPVVNDIAKFQRYIVVGDGDRVDARRYPWGWEQSNFDDQSWPHAVPLRTKAKPHGMGTDGSWHLVPRTIPMMEEFTQRLSAVRRTENVAMDNRFLKGISPVTIPAKTKAVFLLDQGHLTNAYPELTMSGGKDSKITLLYAEAMMDAKRRKGDRNEVEGRNILGFEDQYISDGGKLRTFRPLWFRTYRYVQIVVETGDEALVLDDLKGKFTGYPFEQKAAFTSSDTSLKQIWDVGWRTARLCAGENYYDCPFYEQLQYIGDTRIQALISLYVSGDDRLMKKAITDFYESRYSDGLTQSRYPSSVFQSIPPFSLFWVSMIHDYWMHRQDDAFIQKMLPAIESVLIWHEQRLAANGMNGPLEWWNFVDWAKWNAQEETAGGVPPGAKKGGSGVLSLQQVYTLRMASDLFENFGQKEKAVYYRKLADKIVKSVREQCWDPARGLFADTPEKTSFSQHGNILAILTDAVPVKQQTGLVRKILSDSSLIQTTFYFKFYLFQALKKTGMGDEFISLLKPWHQMLSMGLTTFAENPEPTRSDCHAWSASPVYEFLSTVCGINPASPGFRTVRISPNLGSLRFVDGKMPHPAGDISVHFEKTATGGLSGNISLPEKISGNLIWKGQKVPLKSGTQTIKLR